MKEVYVVMCLTGDCCDSYQRPVLIVDTEEEAKKEVERLSSSVPEHSDHLERLFNKVYDIAEREANKASDDTSSETWAAAYRKVCDHFYALVEKKYPHLTADRYYADAYFYYEKCEIKANSNEMADNVCDIGEDGENDGQH